MAKRNVLLIDCRESSWPDLLKEFMEDTASVLTAANDTARGTVLLDQLKPDIIFIHSSLLTLALAQKLKALAVARPELRIFRLGPPPKPPIELASQFAFEITPSLADFQKQLVQYLPLPEQLRLLIIDDEQEVAHTFRDFCENRSHPAILVFHADNGRKGLEALKKKLPDIVVLDIKMPVKDGREVYREIRQQNLTVPVIIFFDAVSGEELVEIRRLGNPVVVEKGSRESSMPEMIALIKKLAYFC